MIKNVVISIIAGAVFMVVLPLVHTSYGAILQLEPSTVSTMADRTFEVKISVNSGGEEINAVDAFVLYDASILEAVSVNEGAFFPTVLSDTKKSGRLYVAGMVDNPGTFKIGAGTVAIVIMKAKKSGSATVTFDCTQGSTTDSNIVKNDLNASDIIVCASNGSLLVTVAESDGVIHVNPTQTPTPVVVSLSTPTVVPVVVPPKALPKSGVFDNMLRYATPGIVLLIIGFGMRLLL